MDDLIRRIGRIPTQRTTTYGPVPEERTRRSYQAAPITDMIQTKPGHGIAHTNLAAD
jgi:hypothetical protein